MCDGFSEVAAVMAIVGAAASATGSVVQANAQKSSAKAQEEAIQDGLAKDRAATARQYQQIQETSQNEQAQRHTEYLIDQARIMSIAGESGLQGATTDRIAQENANNAEADMATLESNRQRQMEMAHTQGLSSSTKGNVQLMGIRRPSDLATGLQIAGSAADAYGKTSKPSAPNKGTYTGVGDGYGSWKPSAGQKGLDW